MLCFFFFYYYSVFRSLLLFKQYLKIFLGACMFWFNLWFLLNKQLLHRHESGPVATSSTHPCFVFSSMTVTLLSHPSSLSPESGANDSEISDTQTQLFEDVTSCYYLAQQLVPMDTRWRLVARPFSVSLYVQPECSSTSDCRKLHGHFNTVFLFSLFFCSFREQKEKCIIIWKTSNLYAGEKIFTIYIYKKRQML